ncbi:FKBP-type peptidyl-prolyl cis-trans isomerase [Ferrimonas pelagia]|uniref:Peptidyl-prolyl cis-trans isomerase n=1 Tax=Ferrimonas pelagia TaxID=1177826 RepID=A0ABP9END2_9GAMM
MFKIIVAVVVIAASVWLFQRNQASKKLAVENIERGEIFLTENGQKEGVITTESGLQYEVLQEGEGAIYPRATDKVTVHYHGTFPNGTVFDSSVERGVPATFGLNQVIPGWTEGVQTMVVGQKNRFYIPARLAYGNRAVGTIPPGSLLVFEVELLDIGQ